ncbi:MAG TPA: amidohydrolase family protein [Acidimicrobiales bacterium]
MEDRLIVVSSDSHAGIPRERWEEYLPAEFHDLLPSLRRDNVIYPTAMALLQTKAGARGLPEIQEVHEQDWHGLHDATIRLVDMDREGIAAELIFEGDSRLGDLFHNVPGRAYSRAAWEAGARAWNRWAADEFGFAMERFLVTGAIGPCEDMDATVAELHWMADHDFTAVYGPGYMRHSDMPPLFDRYWDPFWAACEERNLPLVVHAGFGTEHGAVFPVVERIYDTVVESAGTTDRDTLLANAQAVPDDAIQFFHDWVTHNVDSRRPMWQLMLGGVFDRFPGLRLLLTEIRLDWIPATLAHLDRVFEDHRAQLPAQRRPSEYWATNCLAGASFIHKVEAEMRHEIGVEQILFGRDFPHPEGTWPNTRDWLRLAFEGVPADDARLMLGENAIRFFGLDRQRLAEIAKRIGPDLDEVIHGTWDVRPELFENFENRGGYSKPAEGDAKLPLVAAMIDKDLAVVAGTT